MVFSKCKESVKFGGIGAKYSSRSTLVSSNKPLRVGPNATASPQISGILKNGNNSCQLHQYHAQRLLLWLNYLGRGHVANPVQTYSGTYQGERLLCHHQI
mmetsp:Transcript_31939/g.48851  ORF Transcript_31939/g.48851 Transcript_31939/m.48851 type:complete len:100 (+) Transcript_31939:380-679(+)